MPSGKSFKFHGSTIEVMTGVSADSPSIAISAITQADPAVVSAAGHGLASGDVIQISGALGMTEVNDELFVVNVLTSGTFELVNVDSSSYGAYAGHGAVDPVDFSNFCELTGYNRQGGTSAEIDKTSLCSEAKEFEVDLPDFGTTQMDYKFAPRTAIQEAIADYYSGDHAGQPFAVRITLPNNGGYMMQLGRIQQTSEQAGNGSIWTGSLTIRNSGARVDVAAA